MPALYPYFPILLAATGTTAAILAVALLRTKDAHVKRACSGLCLSGAIWSSAYALELVATSPAAMQFWGQVQYFGITAIPVAWLTMAAVYAGKERRISRHLPSLLIVPAVVLLSLWVAPWRSFVWRGVRVVSLGTLQVLEFDYGPGFWIHLVYSYLLVAVGTVWVLRCALRSANRFQGQGVLLLLAVFMPWIGNILYVAGANPFAPLDLTPLMFSFSGIAMSFGLLHFRLVDIAPHARMAAFASTADGLIVRDRERRVVDLNPAAERIVGRSLAAANGHELPHDFIGGCPLLSAGASTSARDELIRDLPGGQRHFDLHVSPILGRDGDPSGDLVVLRDLTEERRLEEQLRQTYKMEAVGQLAGGIAHDFNNVLTAITGFASLLQEELEADDRASADAQEILLAAGRAAALTGQLLAFSRRQVLAPQVLDLNAVVSDIRKMLRRVIRENIKLTTRLDPDLEPVRADRGQLEQVIVNLAVNGSDAMPEGGELTIETTNALFAEPRDAAEPSAPGGPCVALAVHDSGCGMSPETPERIFEPFFTTKEPGEGTGMGMAGVYGIVTQSGGSVSVDSRLGRGTTVTVCLPQVTRPAEEPGGHKEPGGRTPTSERDPGGHETVLLVEDEPAVRDVARRALSCAGYDVLVAALPEAAVRICEEYRGTIHLLLTDVVMPDRSGQDLARLLSRSRPDMKTLYMSGYPLRAINGQSTGLPDAPFLQKPFAPGVLTAKVRAVLESAAIAV